MNGYGARRVHLLAARDAVVLAGPYLRSLAWVDPDMHVRRLVAAHGYIMLAHSHLIMAMSKRDV